MKNRTLKWTLGAVVALMILSAPSATAQWDSPGTQLFTHGSNSQPRIQGSGALLEFVENSNAAGGTANGLKFSRQGQVSPITEAYLHYQTNFNLLVYSKTGNLNDKKFTVDADNGNVEVIGELEVAGEIVGASDARLKKDMAPLTNALAKVSLLKPTTYQFRNDEFANRNFPEGTRMGFIAQEVEKDFPTLVSTGNEVADIHGNAFDMKSVNYVEVIPLLTKAIQEQQALIAELTGTVAGLKTQVAELQGTASR